MMSNYNFLDWFDVDDKNHILAYRTLQNTGSWPKGFLSGTEYFDINWQTILAFKLANKWVEHVIND